MKFSFMTCGSKVLDLDLETIITLSGHTKFFKGFFLRITINIGSLVPAADAVKASDIFIFSNIFTPRSVCSDINCTFFLVGFVIKKSSIIK